MKARGLFGVCFLTILFLAVGCNGGGGGGAASGGGGSAGPVNSTIPDDTADDSAALERVEREEAIVLTENEELVIENKHYVLKNSITLQGNARLIIRNAIFEQTHEYAFQHRLDAFGNSEVIVENSAIHSSGFMHWAFFESSHLELTNVDQSQSHIWHYFKDGASAEVVASNFKATLDGGYSENGLKVSANIRDCAYSEIEFVFPVGAVVNESLPQSIENKVFPNEDDSNLGLEFRMSNVAHTEWGIGVLPTNDITISDSESLVVTFAVIPPWWDMDVTLDGLINHQSVEDRTWTVGDSRLRLLNINRVLWSPIVGGNNVLRITNSDIGDNSSSAGSSTLIIENTRTSVIRGQGSMNVTIRNSVVSGDVVATESSTITLIDTVVTGQLIEADNGRIFVQNSE